MNYCRFFLYCDTMIDASLNLASNNNKFFKRVLKLENL